MTTNHWRFKHIYTISLFFVGYTLMHVFCSLLKSGIFLNCVLFTTDHFPHLSMEVKLHSGTTETQNIPLAPLQKDFTLTIIE